MPAFLDIFFFALVAIFLFLQLRRVLGRRTGEERRHDPFQSRPVERSSEGADAAEGAKIIPLPGRDRPGIGPAPVNPAAMADVARIRAADPSFDGGVFVSGAKSAFEMILGAYAGGKHDILRPLLAEDVYARFAAAITAREKAGHVLETTLVSIRTCEIAEARLDGSVAHVTVEFVTEQVNVTRDVEGRVVEGDASEIEVLTDLWTFTRDTKSRDPNWVLTETRVPE